MSLSDNIEKVVKAIGADNKTTSEAVQNIMELIVRYQYIDQLIRLGYVEWVDGREYQEGSRVSYMGKIYQALKMTRNPPTNRDDWIPQILLADGTVSVDSTWSSKRIQEEILAMSIALG